MTLAFSGISASSYLDFIKILLIRWRNKTGSVTINMSSHTNPFIAKRKNAFNFSIMANKVKIYSSDIEIFPS